MVKCKNCIYSIEIYTKRSPEILECRKGLPMLDPRGRSAWPRVSPDDGCFKGKEKTKEMLNE